MPPLDEVIPGSIGVLLCLGGLAVFLRLVGLGLASKGWAETKGRVTHSVLEMRRGRNGRSYRARISYAFDGKTGRRIYFGDFFEANQAIAEELVKKYPVGKEIAVFHSGGQSCLERRIDLRVWLFLFGCAGLAAVIAGTFLRNAWLAHS